MKKSLLFLTFAAGMAFCANAQDVTYNYFDPADCDADGWLWLDTQEKIDKYVGEGKKIQLVPAEYEIDDPDFPGEYIPVESSADPSIKGYNTEGVEGGEGSKTGGLILPPTIWGDYWDDMGGGFIVAMPDCAVFDVYMSQSTPNIYTELDGAISETYDTGDFKFIWYYGYDYFEQEYIPLSENYVATDDLTNPEYTYTYEGSSLEGTEGQDFVYQIAGEKGCGGRSALYINYGQDSDLIIHGLRIRTYTSVSADTVGEAGVESIAQDSLKVSVKGGVVQLSSPAQIAVYSPSGAKVAGGYGSSLDCSALKGIYFVKAGNKTVKAVF